VRLEARVEERTIKVEVRRTEHGYSVRLDDATLQVDLVAVGRHFLSLIVDGQSHDVGLETLPGGYLVHLREGALPVLLADPLREVRSPMETQVGPTRLTAPMPGRVVRVLAEKGREVEPGQGLIVIEAMKMENELKAPRRGCVHEVAVREGQAVEAGALLLVVA
jgi:acetyl/propionyl-CoA carboxylase alpha subunit